MDDWRILASADDDHDTGDYDVGGAFGEHDIEYWVYDGKRLVPASPDEAERLRELEAWPRLTRWQEQQRSRARLLALRRLVDAGGRVARSGEAPRRSR